MEHICRVCGGKNRFLGVVPLERNNQNIPIVDNTPIEYYICTECDFLSCPSMLDYTPERLGVEIYNDDYVKFDPDYLSVRPTGWAKSLSESVHPNLVKRIKHLDYGSGKGIMSTILRTKGWNSTSYDPYDKTSSNFIPNTKFNLITAIEVVEHSLNIQKTIEDMKQYLDLNTGAILFSTLLADKNTTIDWWYIMARNGHIGILSEKSLKILAKNNGLFFSSINSGLHVLQSSRSNLKNITGIVPHG